MSVIDWFTDIVESFATDRWQRRITRALIYREQPEVERLLARIPKNPEWPSIVGWAVLLDHQNGTENLSLMFRHGAPIATCGMGTKQSPRLQAIRHKCTKPLSVMLTAGADPSEWFADIYGYDHDTLLGIACAERFVEGAKLLIEAGANTKGDGVRVNPMLRALGAPDLVRILANAGGSHRSEDPVDILRACLFSGDKSLVEEAVRRVKRASPRSRIPYDLLIAAVRGRRLEAIDALLSVGADPNAFLGGWLESPLAIACAFGSDHGDDVVNKLLEGGADPNLPSGPAAETPIFRAAENMSISKVRLLISFGADPAFKNKHGETVLTIRGPIFEHMRGPIREVVTSATPRTPAFKRRKPS